MLISVFVPEYGVIEAVTPPFRSFNTANEFLSAFGKEPVFQVEYVGLHEYVPANNGEYTIKTNRLLKDVISTDLLIIPPAFGDTSKGIRDNAEAIPYFKKLYENGSSHLLHRCHRKNTESFCLNVNDLVYLFDNFPEMERYARLSMGTIFGHLMDRITSLRFTTAKEKYEHFLLTYHDTYHRIPLGMVASYLGITQETLSRIRAEK